jgi:hypothetical protein
VQRIECCVLCVLVLFMIVTLRTARRYDSPISEDVLFNVSCALNGIVQNRTRVRTVETSRTVHRGLCQVSLYYILRFFALCETFSIMVVLLAWPIQFSGPIICIIHLQNVKYRAGGRKEPWSMFI